MKSSAWTWFGTGVSTITSETIKQSAVAVASETSTKVVVTATSEIAKASTVSVVGGAIKLSKEVL